MKLLKNKLTVTIIVLSVAFLGLITLTVSREDKGFESGAGSTLNPVQKVAYGFNRGVKDFVDFFLNFSDVRDENKELKKENDKLKAEIDEYSKLKEENERLQKVLNFKDEKNNYDYIGTNIIGISGDSILNGYIVDRGKDDGIEKGMVVISADGLVGQVSSVGKNWAIVQCIVNENVKVAVMVDSTRENTGILQGYKDYFNNNLAKVLNLPIDSEVKEGDVSEKVNDITLIAEEKSLVDEFGGFIIVSSEENQGRGLSLKPVIAPEGSGCGSCGGGCH